MQLYFFLFLLYFWFLIVLKLKKTIFEEKKKRVTGSRLDGLACSTNCSFFAIIITGHDWSTTRSGRYQLQHGEAVVQARLQAASVCAAARFTPGPNESQKQKWSNKSDRKRRARAGRELGQIRRGLPQVARGSRSATAHAQPRTRLLYAAVASALAWLNQWNQSEIIRKGR